MRVVRSNNYDFQPFNLTLVVSTEDMVDTLRLISQLDVPLLDAAKAAAGDNRHSRNVLEFLQALRQGTDPDWDAATRTVRAAQQKSAAAIPTVTKSLGNPPAEMK